MWDLIEEEAAWYNLEELEISYAKIYGSIYSVSGPIFKDNLGAIGANKVTIPGYFYKAFLLPNKKAAVGIILKHQPGKQKEFTMISIDSLETFTNIDFFPSLDDEIEDIIESEVNLYPWMLNDKYSLISTSTNPTTPANSNVNNSQSVSVQCSAIASSTSNQCKRKTTNLNGLCWQHQDKPAVKESKPKPTIKTGGGQCRATTQAGSRCKRSGGTSGYCWQH